MKIGIIGCGYVFDHYMTTIDQHPEIELVGVADINQARADKVAERYATKSYPSNQAMLADPSIELIVNLTSIEAHGDVIRAALEAGKHVYSEKPIVTDLDEARALFSLAEARGVKLSAAPCNVLSDSVQTMWRAIRDGAVGRPRLVYAEFDDNPVYLMAPEGWSSRTGAPWPYLHEYEQGCTFEHAGYHLTWLVAIFGPVESVTAFSACLVPDKTDQPLSPPDTPDFSVAALAFKSGVVARLTCSIIAPLDHRMRVIGDEGEISIDTYRHYEAPVRLERFSKLSLNARKASLVRNSSIVQRTFGIGGRSLPHSRRPGTAANGHGQSVVRPALKRSPLKRFVDRFKRQQTGAQDKCLGIAEMIRAIESGRPLPLPPDFVLHVTELTLAIQRAGRDGAPHRLQTTFEPLAPLALPNASTIDYRAYFGPALADKLFNRAIDRLHRHG